MTEIENSVDGRQKLGALLQQTRQEKGLEVSDVSAELKLLKAAVKGLEQGDYHAIKGGVFVKGYIKAYAQFLNLNVDECLRLYEEAGVEQDEIAAAAYDESTSRSLMLKKAAAAIAVVLVVLLGYSLLSGDSEQEPPAKAPSVISPEPIPETLAVEPELAIVTEAPVLPEPPVAAASNDSIDEAQTAAVQSDTEALYLSFSDDCWVEITDANGERLLSDLKRAGEKVVLNGVPPFEALFGYGPAVTVSYQGEPVDFTVGVNPTVKLSIGEKQ